jgi:hypothetical protein
MKTKILALWAKLPERAQSALRALVFAFVGTFVALAAPLLPAIYDSLPYIGTAPNFQTTKALTAALVTSATVGALRVAIPLAAIYTKALIGWVVGRLTLPAAK